MNINMDSECNLDTLMARYQAGDFAAVTALIECIGPQLHRFFMAQSASRSDADDLLQETWLRIHRVRHTYRPANRCCPGSTRSRAACASTTTAGRAAPPPERRLEECPMWRPRFRRKRLRRDDLETLLAPLSEKQREVIRMMKVAGCRWRRSHGRPPAASGR
jgi:RNA polymerase sigma-70 factor (ECF subfamily)